MAVSSAPTPAIAEVANTRGSSTGRTLRHCCKTNSSAAVALVGGDEVATTLEPGAAIFAGTHPSCTVVRANIEYHCTLDKPPLPEVQDFKGTVEPTVDATKHVNGGCRSLTSDGLSWECYLGEEAVTQQIVSEGFLGEYAPSPGHG